MPNFNLSATRRRLSRPKMIEALHKFAKNAHSPYTASAYKASKPNVSVDVLNREFGSFRSACEAAGLSIAGMKQEYSDEALIVYFENLIKWRAEKGFSSVVPSILDFNKYKQEFGNGISHSAFVRRFGNYKRFLELYQRYHDGELTRNTLIDLAKKQIKPKREDISMALRAKVLHRDGYRCTSCGIKAKDLSDGQVLELDHLVPVADWGATTYENLTARCSACNRGKGARFQG